MPEKRTEKKQIDAKAKRNIIFATTTIAALLLIIFVVVPQVKNWMYAKRVPALPDLEGQPTYVADYLKQIHEEAMNDPASDKSIGKLGMAYQANFFYENAEECYYLASEMNDNSWLWFYYQALIKEELGDSKTAINLLTKVVDIDSQVTPAWYKLGTLYLKMNFYSEAENAFKKVINLREYDASEVIGFKTYNKGAFPLKAYAQLNFARAEFQQGNNGTALKTLFESINEFKRFGPAYRLLGQVYENSGEKQIGKDYTIQAGDFDSYIPPDDPMFDAMMVYSRNSDFLLKQIDLAIKSKSFRWAIFLTRQIFDYNHEDANALLKLIQLSLDLHRLEGIESLLRSFLILNKDNETNLLGMAQYCIMRRQAEYGMMFLNEVLRLNPNSADAYFEKIKLLRMSNQTDEGIKEAENALKKFPNDTKILDEYGRLLILNGGKDKAKTMFTKAIKINSKDEIALIMLGILAKNEKDVNSAVNYYKRSIDANKKNTKTVVALVNYYIELRRWKSAIDLLESSMMTSPNDNGLLERYTWLLATCPDLSIRNTEKALQVSKRLEVSNKSGPEEEVKAGIVLSVAYASNAQFDKAVEICDKYIPIAQQYGLDKMKTNLEYFKEMFKNKTAISL